MCPSVRPTARPFVDASSRTARRWSPVVARRGDLEMHARHVQHAGGIGHHEMSQRMPRHSSGGGVSVGGTMTELMTPMPPSPRNRSPPPELRGGERGGTLSGKGKQRRRLRKRYPTLAILATLMVLWTFSTAIYHVVMGFQKVYIRSMFFSIERPHYCPPSTPAPQDIADDDPIEGLPPADMKDLPSPIPSGKPKVGIVSLCDHNVDAICSASVANKQAYADHHGYDVIVDGDLIDESRPTSWSKLLVMRKYLPYYDFLFYVDVDTVITNVDVKLEDVVDYGYDQILAADKNGLNCGVWLIRNTPWSLWFLDEMWAQEQLVSPRTFVLFKFEQRAMHFLYQSRIWRTSVKGDAYKGANTIRARTKVVNSCVFNSLPAWYVKGDFLVHLAGLKGVAKCMMFRHYYATAQSEIVGKYGRLSAEADMPPPSLGTCLFGSI